VLYFKQSVAGSSSVRTRAVQAFVLGLEEYVGMSTYMSVVGLGADSYRDHSNDGRCELMVQIDQVDVDCRHESMHKSRLAYHSRLAAIRQGSDADGWSTQVESRSVSWSILFVSR